VTTVPGIAEHLAVHGGLRDAKRLEVRVLIERKPSGDGLVALLCGDVVRRPRGVDHHGVVRDCNRSFTADLDGAGGLVRHVAVQQVGGAVGEANGGIRDGRHKGEDKKALHCFFFFFFDLACEGTHLQNLLKQSRKAVSFLMVQGMFTGTALFLTTSILD
jgi:hypothetical protein